MPKKHKSWHELRTIHKVGFAVLIGFAVISFWRGIWGLMDLYLLPNDYAFSLWISVFLGLVILIITGYAKRELI